MIIIKLSETLQNKGISKYKFALTCGLSYRTICDYCSNKVQLLNKEYLSMFCHILNCQLSDIIVNTKEK